MNRSASRPRRRLVGAAITVPLLRSSCLTRCTGEIVEVRLVDTGARVTAWLSRFGNLGRERVPGGGAYAGADPVATCGNGPGPISVAAVSVAADGAPDRAAERLQELVLG